MYFLHNKRRAALFFTFKHIATLLENCAAENCPAVGSAGADGVSVRPCARHRALYLIPLLLSASE